MEKVTVTVGGRQKTMDKKMADLLVRIGKAKYDNTYENKMMTSKSGDKKAELKKVLDAAGVEYDGRSGEAKLQELVDALKD